MCFLITLALYLNMRKIEKRGGIKNEIKSQTVDISFCYI